MIRNILFLCVGLLFIVSPVTANDDEGLYDPLPPEGSAFVRFIHADPKHEDIIPMLGKKAFGDLSFQEVTPYFVKKEGKAALGFDDIKIDQDVVSGKFYSVTYTNGTVHILEDYVSDNRAKAVVLFYNLTDNEALSLKTEDGKVEIIGAAAPNTNGHREMNAVRLTTAVYDGEKQISTLEPEALERGTVSSVFAFTATDGTVHAISLRSRTDTTQ